MHKRAVRDVSPRVRLMSRRYRSGPGAPQKLKALYSKRQSKPDGKEPDEKNIPVSDMLRSIITPEVCQWLEGKEAHVVKSDTAKMAVFAPSQSASTEKDTFDSMGTFDEEDILNLPINEDGVIDESRRIPAGSLVEVRRSQVEMKGVVLFTVLQGRQWYVNTLAANGEVWQHFEHDVTFQIPNFVEKDLAKACGMNLEPTSEEELNTRVDILQRLRTFQINLDHHCYSCAEKARAISFYDLVAHPDPKTWTNITLHDAASKIYGKSSFSTEELLAAQSYLFSASPHFVPVSRRFLQRPTFWIRSRQEVDDIQTVSAMVLHNSPALKKFIDKARSVITASRRRGVDSYNAPPSKESLEGLEWTEEDKTIVRFFFASMEDRRAIQEDHFIVPVAHILKSLELYDKEEEYTTPVAHKLLIEMGLLAPWEELNTRGGVQRHEATPLDLVPSIATPIIPNPLGPTDFYSQDIVESLRHDFGDLPVYVVDDWDAEELDDGISVERIPSDPDHVWLHVHVADPTVHLPPTHHLATHAMLLGTARYHVHGTDPMLPPEAGLHRFSLGNKPGQADQVLTFSAKINSTGDITDYKVRPSIIRRVQTIRYNEVDTLLGHDLGGITKYPFGHSPTMHPPRPHPGAPDPTIINDFRLLRQITSNISAVRFKQGALTFAFPHLGIHIEPRPFPPELRGATKPSIFHGFPSITYSVSDVLEWGARGIVAECMKTAGRVASLFFRDRGIPAARRTVGPLTSELRDGVKNVMAQRRKDSTVDVYSALRERVTAPSGEYTTKPAMHSLMGIPEGEGYVKVTSPLRRFGDMLAHWQIKHALLAERGERASPILFDEPWLAEMALDIGMRELEARRTESLQLVFWAHSFLLRWMNDPARDRRAHDPLKSLKAHVVALPAMNFRKHELFCVVHIPELALNGRVRDWPLGHPCGLGDEVDVQIDSIMFGMRPTLNLALTSR